MKKGEANLNQGDFILQSKYWRKMLLKYLIIRMYMETVFDKRSSYR